MNTEREKCTIMTLSGVNVIYLTLVIKILKTEFLNVGDRIIAKGATEEQAPGATFIKT